jgi:lactoylglutathione lyase
MFPQIHSVVVVVPDQDAALDFYTRILGWEKRDDNQMSPDYRFLTVVPPGLNAGIALGPAHIHGYEAPGPDNPKDVGINLVAPDVRSLHEQWTANGVAFDMPPTPMPWGGYAVRFMDPFGNRYFMTDAQ